MAETVYLISRDKRIAAKVRGACEELEAEFRQARSVDEADDDFATSLPDLVICDYASFEQLRERHGRACVLLYTEAKSSR